MAARAARAPLVCRWDLDKTYLRSEFASLRDLLRTAFEKGEDKIEVPGVAELIRGLKAAATRHQREAFVYFLSASPPQIGKAIRDKLALDQVPYDGIVFKNQLANLKSGKLRNLREQVGYKLFELLKGRLAAPANARELLFGDDWESDTLIYSLYADVLAGRMAPATLAPILRRVRVDPALIAECLALAEQVTRGDVVVRIFINLERRSPPATFRLFGPRVVPAFNYFQTAAVLAVDGFLDPEDVVRVARVLVERAGYSTRRLENSLTDLVRRAHLRVADAERLAGALRRQGALPNDASGRVRWRTAWRRLVSRLPSRRRSAALAVTAPLDYDEILAQLRPIAEKSA